MARIGSIGLGGKFLTPPSSSGSQWVVRQYALRRILAFRNRTIDDVVNNPIVKNEILSFFKLQKQIERVSETRELEDQWNGVA